MKGKKIGILIGVSAVVVAVGASVTVTQQNEYKLIRQFGKVDRVISTLTQVVHDSYISACFNACCHNGIIKKLSSDHL